MTSNNRTKEDGNHGFKQIEGEGWLSTYLPAISAGTVMAVVLFLAISCSNKSDNAAKIKAPDAPVVAGSAPSSTVAASVPVPPKKPVKKHRPANATYVNAAYGVSFSYPVRYSLQAGKEQSALPVTPGFIRPGAVEIASVDMPDSTYTDTDFSAGLLNVTVNPALTSEECAKFLPSTETLNSDVKSAEPTNPASNTPKPESVKLGSNQFTVLETMRGEAEHQSDLKYFHLFKNGACYEFALDVETSRKPDEELAQVDRGKVFQQLAKILTTARIKDVQLPAIDVADKPAESKPAADVPVLVSPATTADKTAQVETPQQK